MLNSVMTSGQFDPKKIATELMTSTDDLARSAGLGKDAISRTIRLKQPRTQRRLREVVEVLLKVELRFGSSLAAYAWFRAQPFPGFSNKTAMQLVQDGQAQDVLEYIDAIDAGVYA